jgi:hypothetical protein
MVETGAFQSI